VAATALNKPPEFKTPPTIDPEEERRRFAERATLARSKAAGGFGVRDTTQTSPQGIAGGGSVKGSKTLLGQ
jgi:hypothetical protein